MSKPQASFYRGMAPKDLVGKSYAKYWNADLAPLSAAVTAALTAGFQSSDRAIEFDAAATLQAVPDESRYFETGYARLASDLLYVAVSTPMPEVTGKMILWWFGWHGEETQRYKLWHPKDHLSVQTYAKIDAIQSIDPLARHLGVVSHVKEYIGDQIQSLAISFAPPEAFGLTAKAMADAGIEAAICARIGYSFAPLAFGHLVHIVQRLPTGKVVMRSRFWLGDVTVGPVMEKRGKRLALGGMIARHLIINETQIRALLVHCAEEMQHLASFLPSLYADHHRG